ncbi:MULTISPECIES: restriction endonuclease [Marinobacter]|uniref:Restriction endonuclease n=1 Tax=Marinobacter shengliensis TaxID=1389223 RepID=A0ABV4WC08_9GAMM
MDGEEERLKPDMQRKIDALGGFKEDDLTKRILVPLFQAMGYTRVEFNGGPNERGRDLIAQKDNPPSPNPKTIYVQTKRIDSATKSAGGAKFDKMVFQVRQCLNEPVTDIHGKEYRADEVYLVCPEQIGSRFIDEIKSSFFASENKSIHLIDGVNILGLIDRFKPDLVNILLNIEDKIISKSGFSPGNSDLLEAIKQVGHKNIEKLYNDLSFFVGSIDSNLLLHFEIKLLKKVLPVEEENWDEIKRQLQGFCDRHNVKINQRSLSEVEEEFVKKLSEFNSEANQSLISEKVFLQGAVTDARKGIDELYSNLISRAEKLTKTKEISDDEARELKRLIKDASEGASVDKFVHEEFSKGLISLGSYNKKLKESENRLSVINKKIIQRPKYILDCNYEDVKSNISERINRYFSSIEDINSGEITKIELKKFLLETEETLALIDELVTSWIAKCFFEFSFSREKQDRVAISAHDIFETGHDIAVYGSAGVGKTTTLEMYSKLCDDVGKDVVYVPLNRTVDRLSKIKSSNHDEFENGQSVFVKDLLIKAVLVSRKIEPDTDQIESAKRFFSKGPALVLDGLDEAFSAVSELIPAIKNYKHDFPKSQIIISSRDCVSYLKDIDFFGITLLPFTKKQLSDFIKNWFEFDYKKSQSLIERIDKDEGLDALRTPLLATIVCSLVEKGVKAPSSESEVYSERFRLLVGDYDKHKGISRQSNTSSRLSEFACYLALVMHEKRVRSLPISTMKRLLQEKVGGRFSKELIDSCLSELIDPCCILFHDPISKEYSFGHFRFQEHLVAKAIRSDRGISIAEVTAIDWWRGALCIYAQEGNISSIVEDVYRLNGNIKKSLITLREMASNAPRSERYALKSIIDLYAEQDDLENLVLEEYGYDSTLSDLDDFGL